jgi:hypothetical protein
MAKDDSMISPLAKQQPPKTSGDSMGSNMPGKMKGDKMPHEVMNDKMAKGLGC